MLALTFHFCLQSFSLYISLLVVTGFYTTVCQHIGWWGIFCNEAESISPLYYSRDGYYSSYFPGFSLSNIARFRFLVSKRCCIAHFPLPRALLSSRRSMLPVHANVAPILPSPLSDVSQVAVNRPQATSHKPQGNGDSVIRKIRNPGLWNPESETLFDSFTWGDTVEKPSKSNSVNHMTVFIKVFFYPSMSVLF